MSLNYKLYYTLTLKQKFHLNLFRRHWWVKSVYIFLGHSVYMFHITTCHLMLDMHTVICRTPELKYKLHSCGCSYITFSILSITMCDTHIPSGAKGLKRRQEERVFMEKVYRSSKWWEVKDWGENVSELVIGKKKTNNKKLHTVLSYLGVFTFCTCCKILICLMCIVASFKLSCV